jgi:hypothetical protein
MAEEEEGEESFDGERSTIRMGRMEQMLIAESASSSKMALLKRVIALCLFVIHVAGKLGASQCLAQVLVHPW